VPYRRKKLTFAISSPDECLFYRLLYSLDYGLNRFGHPLCCMNPAYATD